MKNMDQHEMQQIIISLRKSGCYKTSPLKMNLVLEIQMDQKRNLETLPSILLLFPCSFFLDVVTPLHLAHPNILVLSNPLLSF
jgi:hypothetical protein